LTIPVHFSLFGVVMDDDIWDFLGYVEYDED